MVLPAIPRLHDTQNQELAVSTRPKVLALAIGSLIAAGPVHSGVVDSVTWTSNSQGYNEYAYTCPEATGDINTVCGAGAAGTPPDSSKATNTNDNDPGGDPDDDDAIYSWGLLDTAPTSINSTYTWVNLMGYGFRVDSIQLLASDPVGTPPVTSPCADPANPPIGENCVQRNQGAGMVAAWELGSNSGGTRIAEARVEFTNEFQGGGSYTWDMSGNQPGVPPVATNQLVYVDPSNGLNLNPLRTWFPGADPAATYQTPIDNTYASDQGLNLGLEADVEKLAIEPNESIEIRLFETVVSIGQSQPDALLSDMTIAVNGTAANLQAAALDFGGVRIGTSKTLSATVDNGVGDADGFRALGVTASDPSSQNPAAPAGQFSSAGGQNMGDLGFGNTANPSYQFTPSTSYVGSNAPVIVTADVVVQSTDAQGTGFQLSGNAVGPVFSLEETGGGSIGGTITVPDATVGGSGSQTNLTLSNLFGIDMGDLTDLGLLEIGFDNGSGLVDSLFGFSLSGLPATVFEIAANGGFDDFHLLFNPASTGTFNADLVFRTDVGVDNLASGGAEYRYTVSGTGTPGGGSVPAPGTLALMAIALAGIRRRLR